MRLYFLCLLALAGCGKTPDAAPVEPPATSDQDAGTPVVEADASSPDTSTPVDTTAAIAAFDEALASAVCERLTACCSPTDFDAYFGQFKDKPYTLDKTPDAASCVPELKKQFAAIHDKWAQAASRGRMTFDPARGSACVARVKAAGCGVPLSKVIYDPACFGIRNNEVFAKIAPTGAACQDIGDGTYYGECNPAQGYCGSSKTCEAWKKTGEDCQVVPTRLFCGPDLSCDGATPTRPGRCSAPPRNVAIGDTCGSPSGAMELCPANAFCNFESHKCEAKKDDGQPCQYDDECKTAHPYTCSPFGKGTCGQTSFCGGR